MRSIAYRVKCAADGKLFHEFALSDTIFAVSAGLLLLNPIRFESKNVSTPKPKHEMKSPPVQVILSEIRNVEERLDKLEASSGLLQKQVLDVLKNE